MLDLKLKTMALAALLLLVPILLAACDDGDTDAGAGLTREEVQEIVSSEAAQPSLTRAEVEEAIQAAIAVMPQPEPSLTSADVEELIRAAIANLPKPDVGIPQTRPGGWPSTRWPPFLPKRLLPSTPSSSLATPSAGMKRRDGKPLWTAITGSRVLTTSGMPS